MSSLVSIVTCYLLLGMVSWVLEIGEWDKIHSKVQESYPMFGSISNGWFFLYEKFTRFVLLINFIYG